MPGKWTTKAERLRMVELYRRDYTLTEVGKMTGRSKQAVHYALIREGQPRRRSMITPRYVPTRKQIAAAAKKFQAGKRPEPTHSAGLTEMLMGRSPALRLHLEGCIQPSDAAEAAGGEYA